MPKIDWKPFPYPDKAYDYAGTRLSEHWSRLHNGDREPYPTPGDLKTMVEQQPEFAPSGSFEQATANLHDAWRAYHRGDFGQAVELGLKVGPLGYNVANKAANIYATYLETSDFARLALFLEIRRAGRVRLRPRRFGRQRLVFSRAGARPIQPGDLGRQGVGAGARRQSQGQPGAGDSTRAASRRRAYRAGILSRRDPQQGRRPAGRPDLWSEPRSGGRAFRNRAEARPSFGDRPHRIRQRTRHDVRKGPTRARHGALQASGQVPGFATPCSGSTPNWRNPNWKID